MPRAGSPARYTVRSASSVITFWVGIAALLVVVGAPALIGDWRVMAFALGPALLLAWALWIALYRPAVHYDDARAIVINIGRRHVLPWGHVTDIRQGIGLIFGLDVGKPVVAYGAPAPRQPGNIAGAIDRRTRPAVDLNRDADVLDGVRRVAPPSAEPVTSSWERIPLLIGVLLAVAVLVEILAGV